ncbi:MAG: RHS repeat protein [Acidobacteria bacterium]|nr:RHS repeat protein [Acidobacteriota bacterium]
MIRVDEPTTSGLGTISSPNQPTYYSYDVLNNLTTVNQGVQTRNFVYDSLSRLLSATNPESGTINYSYDANGNLTSKTDARSITTSYTYDALNRVVTRTYSDSTPAVGYFYDNLTNGKGKLIKVQNSLSTTEYTSFDILGRVLSAKQTTDGEEYETDYTYNLSGALIEETYPSGRKVKNVLDDSGDLSIVQSKKNSGDFYRPYASNFTYNAAGAVTEMKLGNGRWESTQFNSRLQPTMIGLGSGPTSQNLLKLEYGYGTSDNNGNVNSQTITVNRTGQSPLVFEQAYTYDSLNRITSATEMTDQTQNWKQAYTFDRYGNRNFDEAQTTTIPKNCVDGVIPVVCSVDVPIVNPSVNANNNRLNGTTYDTAGNTITDAQGRTFTYDAENKQVEVENAQSQTIGQYFFDGDGKRVKKIVPSTGEVTVFVYDASGRSVAEYSTVVAPAQDAKVNYLTTDHLGSPRIKTDRNGAVISRNDYLPFGEDLFTPQRTQTLGYTTDDIRQKFTGYEKDDETGLDFAQARMYLNKHGRFTTTDPLISSARVELASSWNRYSYVLGNPLLLTDPTGLFDWGESLGGDTPDDELKKTNHNLWKKRQKILGMLSALGQLSAETAKKMGVGAAQFAKIQRAVAAYGAAGDNNGVVLEIGKLDKGDAITGSPKNKDGGNDYFSVSSGSDGISVKANVIVTFDSLNEDTIVHEGEHVAGRQDFAAEVQREWRSGDIYFDPVTASANLQTFDRENNAYTAESYYVQYRGGETKIWNKGWSEAKRQTAIANQIADNYRDSKGKAITPKNKGAYLYTEQPK